MPGLLSLCCERHYGSDWTEDKRLDFSLDADMPLSVEELCKSLLILKVAELRVTGPLKEIFRLQET